ncbi:MAG: zinc ribbon domain-containing protein [Methanoregula sp.]|nr:zinc ribbon domain-containing protein [Methanoregula sp.]
MECSLCTTFNFSVVISMPFCPECGKPVAPKAKFCRNCGASQLDDALPDSMVPLAAPIVPLTSVPTPAPVPEIPVHPQEAFIPPPVPVRPVAPLVCSSCGSPLSPSEKFCGICGARAGQVVPPAPSPSTPVYLAPAPIVSATPVSPVMGQPSGVRTCTACGNVIKPGDKYCSKCLVIVRDNPPQAAASAPVAPPVPAAIPVPSPALVMGHPSGVRTCNACGNVIKPGDKYCSKCLAIVQDNAPQVAAPVRTPVQPSPAAAPGSYVCASCGSPVTGTEKFCGICGTPVVGVRVPAAAPPQPVQKTCSACGAPVSDTTKFCGGCGAPVGASFRAAEVTQPVVVPTSPAVPAPGTPGTEEMIGVIGNTRKMKLFGASWDSYNIIVTSRRMILAQMTTAMVNAAITEAQQQAKAEGKGFFAIAKDQMTASFQFSQRYETMPPEQALAETPGNFALENSRITAIHLKLKGGDSEDNSAREFRIIIESMDGKFEYVIAENERFVNILKDAYSDRVHMPFGYFSIGAARIKLF